MSSPAMNNQSWRTGRDSERVSIDAIRARVAAQLAQRPPGPNDESREALVGRLVTDAMDQHAAASLGAGHAPLPADAEARVARAVRDVFTGLAGLQPLMDDPDVTNILVNGHDVVHVKYADGRKRRMPPVAGSEEELKDLIRMIAARAGVQERRFDDGVPRLSIRLPDGSRLFAVTAVSKATMVAIRRFPLRHATLDDLVARGALNPALQKVFTAMVRARKNVIICGGTDTGKTTMLRAFAKAIPPEERLITIEDTDELGLDTDPAHPDCVAWQAREANVEGHGEIDQAELVRWSLRMAPDRVILGEARGGEVVPLLNCMSQGNDGSLATIHASSSKQAFSRLMTYAKQAKEQMDFEGTAMLIAGAVHFVVHVDWSNDRLRVVSSVREVLHAEGQDVVSNEVFAPGADRRARPATPIRHDTLDDLVAAGLDPDVLRRW